MKYNLSSSTQPQKDPRTQMDSSELKAASTRSLPDVAQKSNAKDALVMAGGILGAVFLGAVTLVTLSNNRQNPTAQTPAAQAPAQTPPGSVIMDQPATPLTEGPIMPVPPIEQPQPPMPAPGAPPPATPDNNPRANTLVYDVSAPEPGANAPAAPGTAPVSPVLAARGPSVGDLTGVDATFQARASRINNPGFVVPQGTMIPAVLETALNSDLPGYTRALVSRDIKSFDGSRVIIPRGSRLIGAYRSGLSSGQKRLFVTWTRLIRPDGTAIQLADPSTDPLGQAGLTGDVDSHFFKRFGSAMLLSIIGGLSSSLNDSSSNTVVIGTASGANNAATAALESDSKIAPTIKVAQGTPIQVFASRDLDFTQ
ncbi:TrbI/VirB10 family protein [Asticcacaulis endophyticus]|uniref:Type VI secretion protein n=1 Tax=Asticcacaulis endophyticus TaxID=1395890 RepID=A0A918PX48_9CAUL|nr:TrbI/VirB10 family protein [Asticcacaulis endophyticus]GGZ23963.1 type VI secretion protein [Asticcacaulis endophyticus]